tara:strand:- start:5240 stop:13228 length:7989 start_codon:yes stop_codon:yes gene_type:complete
VPHQKSKRQINIPQKVFDLVVRPESNDYITFRDTEYYNQFVDLPYGSPEWPEYSFGGDPKDIIQVNIYGNQGGLISTVYKTASDIMVDAGFEEVPSIKIEPGSILRDLGFRKGRFTLEMDFMRVQAGGPFPVLVNGKDKLYRGPFEESDDGYFFASIDDPASETLTEDRLYVKENKYIIKQISSDRTEAIVIPAYIDDEKYLEDFRLAAYTCLNVFPDAGESLQFPQDLSSKYITLTLNDGNSILSSYINGAIRVKDAYFLGNREVPEVREVFEVEPSVEVEQLVPNLLANRGFESGANFRPLSPWPSPFNLVSYVEGADIYPLFSIQPDLIPSPIGQIGINLQYNDLLAGPDTPNRELANEAYNERYQKTTGVSDGSMVYGASGIETYPWLFKGDFVRTGLDITGQTHTFSFYMNAAEGTTVRCFIKTGAWGSGWQTSQNFQCTGEWQRFVVTFTPDFFDNRGLLIRINIDQRTVHVPGLDAMLPLFAASGDVVNTILPHINDVPLEMAGAMLQRGSSATKYHTNDTTSNDGVIETPTNGLIKFKSDEPDVIHVEDFPEGSGKFTPKMVGGLITISNAIATNDFTQVLETQDVIEETISRWDFQPTGEASGSMGLFKASDPDSQFPEMGWDINLHSKAIEVEDEDGIRMFDTGLTNTDYISRHTNYDYHRFHRARDDKGYWPGTGHIGYHVHWRKDAGVNEDPALVFPDLNYQEWILGPMTIAANESINSTDPDKNYFAKRELGEDTRLQEGRGTSYSKFPHRPLENYIFLRRSLASHNIQQGDTVRLKFKMKSQPVDFDQGKRKGIRAQFYRSVGDRLIEPSPLGPEQIAGLYGNVTLPSTIDILKEMTYPIIKRMYQAPNSFIGDLGGVNQAPFEPFNIEIERVNIFLDVLDMLYPQIGSWFADDNNKVWPDYFNLDLFNFVPRIRVRYEHFPEDLQNSLGIDSNFTDLHSNFLNLVNDPGDGAIIQLGDLAGGLIGEGAFLHHNLQRNSIQELYEVWSPTLDSMAYYQGEFAQKMNGLTGRIRGKVVADAPAGGFTYDIPNGVLRTSGTDGLSLGGANLEGYFFYHKTNSRRNFKLTVIPSLVKLGTIDRESFFNNPNDVAQTLIGQSNSVGQRTGIDFSTEAGIGAIADNNVDITEHFGIQTNRFSRFDTDDSWKYTWRYGNVNSVTQLDNSPYDALLDLDGLQQAYTEQAFQETATQVIDMNDFVNDINNIDFDNLHPDVAARIGAPTNQPIISDDNLFQWNFADQSWDYIGPEDQVEMDGPLLVKRKTSHVTAIDPLDLSTQEPGDPYFTEERRDVNGYMYGKYLSQYIVPEVYDEWEEYIVEFPISDQVLVDFPAFIKMSGHLGDYGTVYLDDIEVSVRRSSDTRIQISPYTILAPLTAQIHEVIDENTVRVDADYDTLAEDQGAVPSNYAVSRYSEFGSGFNIDYVEEQQRIEPIYAKYVSNIIGVEPENNRIIVEKSYQEYGQEIGAMFDQEESIDASNVMFDDYFIRHRLKDKDNLYTYMIKDSVTKNLIINFKPVNTSEYPGGIAYKFMDPLDSSIEPLDQVFIAQEVTPALTETVDLIPFEDEEIPETVLRQPDFDNIEPLVSNRDTPYRSHTDLVGIEPGLRKQLENRLLSGSLETTKINIDYRQFKNFSHFGSVKKRIQNFKTKLTSIETYSNRSASLVGTYPKEGYLENAANTEISSSADQVKVWELSRDEVINGFDDFENYMYFKNEAYVTSSLGEFFDNSAPKISGDGTLISPYVLYSVTSSQFTSWYNGAYDSASVYDQQNKNRLVNLIPEHVKYDEMNSQFIDFIDMIGHHYDTIWTHVKSLTDVHDRSEDITKGIAAALTEPVAKSFGFELKEGHDLVRLPQYELGLQESGSKTGVFSVRYTKRSQKDVTREIWNRLLASMPYLLKTKGTKQSLKGLIASYGIPGSILRIQEYGGPRIDGAPDFEIKQKFTKAVDFNGSSHVEVPWYNSDTSTRAPDTIEFRFKTPSSTEQQVIGKSDATGNEVVAGVKLTPTGSKGNLTFFLSGSTSLSMSIDNQDFYNNEFWSVMVRRRQASITSSFSEQTLTSNEAATQSFDMYAGYFDSGIDKIITRESASMTVSSSLKANWYATSSAGTSRRWFVGGNNAFGYANRFTGSMMEFRYWNSPLTSSAFFNHVAAPKAINGNHASSSYFDLSLRLSFDDNLNLSTDPLEIKDYTFTDDQIYVTASNFPNKVNFSNVFDRQKSFVPKIGFTKASNKVRLEGSQLKTPDGIPAVLNRSERVELSMYDKSGLDSNKLGIYFAPTDVINEDIMLSLADLDFNEYLGDPRDNDNDRYIDGGLDEISDTYWKKWTTRQGFWDYLKLIKYYDLSLFDHIRRFAPGRAKKTIGILIESPMLERPKVSSLIPIPEAQPRDFLGTDDLSVAGEYGIGSATSSRTFADGTVSELKLPVTSSFERRSAKLDRVVTSVSSSDSLLRTSHIVTSDIYVTSGSDAQQRTGHIQNAGFNASGSNDLMRQGNLVGLPAASSSREDFETGHVSSSQLNIVNTIRNFGLDYLQDANDRDYSDARVELKPDNHFLSGLEPHYTSSKLSIFNEEVVYFYSSSVSASLRKAYSSSMQSSEFESIYNMHTGLTRLVYDGCKEGGNTVPDGTNLVVEITETNPFDVTTNQSGDQFVDVELLNE